MPTPLLMIISGPPCSGKTTLGAWLAAELRLPLFHRDAFKELLFDTLGWDDLAWSQRLGGASYALLYHTAEALLRAGRSLIVESNFDPAHDHERLRALAEQHPFLPLQVRCMADGPVLFERFKRRTESGTRHPGHLDHLNVAVYEPVAREGAGPRNDFLDIGGARIDVDTTDFAALDYPRLLAEVRAAIGRLEALAAGAPTGIQPDTTLA
ncbi:MAG TPA: AAA family ATPase [Kouleothrix sp.]|uniref:AAA family ATPase n=1 Tax=Kouleothrix sp. TaxID=2779161 RepID=UPI002C8269E5|nr:AAA family ATPase [Kouleothrix sp.]